MASFSERHKGKIIATIAIYTASFVAFYALIIIIAYTPSSGYFPKTAHASGVPVPANFFGASVNGSFPLAGGMQIGTLGKVGGLVGHWLEPTCDGGTNPNNACYHFSGLTNWVNKGLANNQTLVLDFGIPGWQCGAGSTVDCSKLPTNLKWLSNFATAIATKYKGQIKYYETGNEVNVASNWKDTCSNLVLMHNTIYAAIKAADPSAIVGAPNMAAFNGTITGGGACVGSPVAAGNSASIWLNNFLQTTDANGQKPKVDTVGVHSYANQVSTSPDGCDWSTNMLHCAGAPLLHIYNSFRSVMNSHGISASTPLLVDEGGFGVDNNSATGPYACSTNANDLTACLSNAQQVAYVGRWLVLSASTWADGGGQLSNWYGYDFNWGTLNGTYGMNPQNAAAYGQMESWIKKATFSQQCHVGSVSTLWLCDFTNSSGTQSEVVFNDNQGATVSYTPPSWATAYQPLLGTKSSVSGNITVGYNPILLTTTKISDTTPPSTPTGLTGAVVSASQVNLSWIPSTDNIGVKGYKVFRGGTQIGTTAVASYSDTSAPASGSLTYAVSAYDSAGNTSPQSPSITVAPLDTTAPSVAITSPLNGAAVNGTISYTATASDNVSVAKVELYIDGTLQNTQRISPYSFSLDTTSLANGSHVLTAKAYDAAGNVGTASPITIFVINPTVLSTSTLTTIQAENYDLGGANIGYYDTTSGNLGGQYRPDDVDIKATPDASGGAYSVGWFATGEWMKYSIKVPATSTYTLALRVANGDASVTSTIHVEIDGANVTGPIRVLPTNDPSWSKYVTMTKAGIKLGSGPHTVKLVSDLQWTDVNWIAFTNPVLSSIDPESLFANALDNVSKLVSDLLGQFGN